MSLAVSVRLNKFLVERLGRSRREADGLILAGRVKIDGRKAILGDRVDKNNKVCYNGKIVPFLAEFHYLALNKPENYVCSKRKQGETPTIYELIPKEFQDLKTVGRLDAMSSGLILLTNDGDFAFRMTHPKFKKEKVYLVELDRELAPLHQQMISDFGIELKDGKSQMQLVRLDEGRRSWQVTIAEGRNRQIRRTFGALGYAVQKLKRIQFGKFGLGDLKEGQFVKLVLQDTSKFSAQTSGDGGAGRSIQGNPKQS